MYFWRSFGIALFLHVSFIGALIYVSMIPSTKPILDQTPIALNLEMFSVEVSTKPPSPLATKEIPKPFVQKPTAAKKPDNKPKKEEKSLQNLTVEAPLIAQALTPLSPSSIPSEESLHVNERNEAKMSITEAIMQAILRVKSYPKRAQRMGIEGEVIIGFRWTKNGIENLHIQKSSGQKLLDEHSLEMIQQAMHTFPQTSEPIDITIPIGFKLTNIMKG